MKIEYRVENRKVLVQAVSEFSGEPAVYMRVPTYSYKVGDFAIDKEGSLLFDESVGREEIEKLIDFLARKALWPHRRRRTRTKRRRLRNRPKLSQKTERVKP